MGSKNHYDLIHIVLTNGRSVAMGGGTTAHLADV